MLRRNMQTAILFIGLFFCTGWWEGSTQAATLLAIDYGHENYKVVLVKSGKTVDIVPDAQGQKLTPAILNFVNKKRTFGITARDLASENPERTFRELKSLLGKHCGAPTAIAWQKRHKKHLDFDQERLTCVFYDQDADIEYPVEELVAMQLGELRRQAEQTARESIADAIIMVPGYWNQWQRTALIDAAKLANITRPTLIDDHVASAVSLAVKAPLKDTSDVYVIYELGARCVQVSLGIYTMVPVEDEDTHKTKYIPQVELLAYSWNPHIGGTELDYKLMDWIFEQVEAKGVSTEPHKNVARIRERVLIEAKRAKENLTEHEEVVISIPELWENFDLDLNVTRQDLDNLAEYMKDLLIEPLKEVLQASKIDLVDVINVALMGGATNMPFVQTVLREFVGEKKLLNATTFKVQEAGVMGAAYYGASLVKKLKVPEIQVLEVGVRGIEVIYLSEEDTTTTTRKMIRTKLYKRHSASGVRKIMTVKRKTDFDFKARFILAPMDDPNDFGSVDILSGQVTAVQQGLKLDDPDLQLTGAKVKLATELDEGGLFTIISADVYQDILNKTAEEEGDLTAKFEQTYPLNWVTQSLGLKAMPEEQFELKFLELRDMDQKDAVSEFHQDKKTQLTELLKELKQRFKEDNYTECAKPKELEALMDNHEDITDWLKDVGQSATTDRFQKRINELNKYHLVFMRRREAVDTLEPSIDRCRSTLKEAHDFFQKFDGMKEEERYWNVTEVEEVREKYWEQLAWMDDREGKQRAKKCHEGIVFTIDEMAQRFVSFGMEVSGLTLTKPPHERKPQPELTQEELDKEVRKVMRRMSRMQRREEL